MTLTAVLEYNPQRSTFCVAADGLDAVLTLQFHTPIPVNGDLITSVTFPTFVYDSK